MIRLLMILILCTSTSAMAQNGFDPSPSAVAVQAEVASPPAKKDVVDFGSAFATSPFVETASTPKAFAAEVPPAPPVPTQPLSVNADVLTQVLSELLERSKATPAVVQIPNAGWTEADSRLESRIAALERSQMTEAKVREIARDEIKKVMVELKLKDGTVKQVPVELGTNQQSVSGYAGTFSVPDGGYIVSVDGVPVQRRPATYAIQQGYSVTQQAQSYNAAAGMYQLQAVPSQSGFQVRIQSPPTFRVRSAPQQCRMVNGVKVCN
jgi:sulfur carrier protein ThiS